MMNLKSPSLASPALVSRAASGRGQFAETTVAAATAVHEALAQLVAAVPGNVTKPRELEAALGIDYKLAWRVFLVLRADDALGVAGLIPKRPSVERLLKAAKAKRLAKEAIADFQNAVDQFEEAVRVQAGDRLTFDLIVSGMGSSSGKEQIDVVERRTAFRTNSHIWGSQVDTFIFSYLCRLDRAAGQQQTCELTTRIGFRRLRAGARAIAFGRHLEGQASTDVEQRSALAADFGPSAGASLLPQFCSQPLPEFKLGVTGDNWAHYELADEEIGLANSVNLVSGQASRQSLPAGTGPGHVVDGIMFRTPAERFIFDMVVHRPSFGRVQPRMVTVADVNDKRDVLDMDGKNLHPLPLRVDVQRLPGGIQAAATTHMPRYVEMLNYACERLGWDPAEFDVYRAMVQYPILHTAMMMQFEYGGP